MEFQRGIRGRVSQAELDPTFIANSVGLKSLALVVIVISASLVALTSVKPAATRAETATLIPGAAAFAVASDGIARAAPKKALLMIRIFVLNSRA